MKFGSETGSLINHVATISEQIAPAVGMGCTICSWTDRDAGTIVKVTATQIHVKQDHAKLISGDIFSENQVYEYSPNPDAHVQIFRRNKHGRYKCEGRGLIIGRREKYRDPSF